MMAKKAEIFFDRESHEAIMKSSDPAEIKKLGKGVKHFDDKLWSAIRGRVMLWGVRLKFQQNLHLANKLRATRFSIIAECSPYDDVWGIKLSRDDKSSDTPSLWHGENLLGQTLMKVRSELNTPISPDFQSMQGKVWTFMRFGEAMVYPNLAEAVEPYRLYCDFVQPGLSETLYPCSLEVLEFNLESKRGMYLPRSCFFEMKEDIFNLVKFGRV